MYMNGSILDAEIGPFHDGVSVNVYDMDEKQTYQAVIVGGLAGLPELLRLKRLKGSDEELQELAAQVEMPPLMQPLPLVVKRVKVNKGFMKLVCKLAEAQS
jgi:hypothetical protein